MHELKWAVLGTSQLGAAYGRREGRGVLPSEAATEILDAAWAAGVRAFDTAEAYGVAAERLAAWLEQRGHGPQARVVTKVQAGGNDLAPRAKGALARFSGASTRTLLTHGPADAATWELVLGAARSAGAEAGQSVYGAVEVTAALRCRGVARIQAPGNIFDSRASAARGPAAVPLDLRSVYLQGVLVESPESAERRAPGTARLARAVGTAAAEAGSSAGSLLIAAMLQELGADDRLVIGADAPEQVDAFTRAAAILPATARHFLERVRELVSGPVDPEILDPRTWVAARSST